MEFFIDLNEISDWIETSVEEINYQSRKVETLTDAKLLKKRIAHFIAGMEQKKQEINVQIDEIRLYYNKQRPIKGLFRVRTRRDINNDRDERILIFRRLSAALDRQIGEMRRVSLSIDEQVNEQLEGSPELDEFLSQETS